MLFFKNNLAPMYICAPENSEMLFTAVILFTAPYLFMASYLFTAPYLFRAAVIIYGTELIYGNLIIYDLGCLNNFGKLRLRQTQNEFSAHVYG
jgi:hypothetical protein